MLSRATSARAPVRRIRLACMVRKLRKSIVFPKMIEFLFGTAILLKLSRDSVG